MALTSIMFKISLQNKKNMTESNLTLIYAGSTVTGNLVYNYLESKDIQVFLIDSFQNSLNAGWASPSSNEKVKVMVIQEQSEEAIQHLKDFFSGGDNEE